jgi:hypothetical protein
MVVFSSELLAYYDLTFIILVSTGQARGIQARFFSWRVADIVKPPRDKPVASRGLCLKSPKPHLETVSTVRGSGWVARNAKLPLIMNTLASPIRYPRTVLTVSKRDVLTFEASPSKSRVVIRLYSSKRKTSTGQVRGILCLFRI